MNTRNPKNWPKLSETLTHGRHPTMCQACGIQRQPTSFDDGSETWLTLWIECDERDQPTATVVALCKPCENRLIEPHPRLYHRIPDNKATPGAMPHLCTECIHRRGLDCMNPLRLTLGGPGLNILQRPPVRGFVSRRGSRGQRTGGMFEHYENPAEDCAGRA